MPPKQATLGKFFGKPNGTNPPAKQSKLSFSSKPTPKEKTPSSSSVKENEDVEMKDEESDEDVKPVAKKVADVNIKAEVKSEADTKKRPRESATKSAVKSEKDEVKEEPVEIDEEDDDEEPVIKRLRRNGKVGKEPKTEKINGKSKTEIVAKKPKSMPPPAKKVAKVEEKDEEEEVSSSAKKPTKRSASVVSRSASEAEQDVDEEASEEDEEDEKPETAAKAREKIQTTLKSKAKDPYPDWKPGEPVPYAALCTTFSLIEMTSKRLIITAHAALFLRQVLRLTPDDLLSTVLLMIGKLAADYAGIELGIGESLIMKAIGESTGRSLKVIKDDQKEIGDLGLVAVKSRANQPTMFKPKALTVKGVHEGLLKVATTSGSGAQGQKVDLIKKLLSAADGHKNGKVDITVDKGGASEAKFIVRFLEGKLRLGLANSTVLVALAHAIVCHETEVKGSGKVPSQEQLAHGEQILKQVYSNLPSYDVILPAILEHGINKLRDNCKLQPGIPLKPMLAKPTKAITEVLDRFEDQTFTCEYKYDGERAQIHYVAKDSPQQYPGAASTKTEGGGLAAIFSRNSEDLSKKYPDILGKLNTWVKEDTKSFVLDCESVAWDLEEKKVLPFQQLMTRKKKDVKAEDVKVKVCVFAFDLLFLNGEAVVEKSLRERRELLHSAFIPIEGEFQFASSNDGKEIEEIQQFLDESVKASCEGLMVKMLDGKESGYEPSKRSRNWLKIKKDYLSGIGDSLDLVVLGAYFGKGKRTSVYGAFLLACYNKNSDTYETICNIGTGFSEAILEEFHSQLSAITIDRPKPFYSHSSGNQHQPDVWFEPKTVWEVKTADLTLSPRYKAGCKEGVDSEKGGQRGISLRFPRFIKIRDDKTADMATTSRQVAEMYRNQESVTKNKGPAVDDDYEY